jgi:hypothetical protein
MNILSVGIPDGVLYRLVFEISGSNSQANWKWPIIGSFAPGGKPKFIEL